MCSVTVVISVNCSHLEWSADVPPESAAAHLWFPLLIYPETAHKPLPAGPAPSWLSPEGDTLTVCLHSKLSTLRSNHGTWAQSAISAILNNQAKFI